jgi:predicted ester cyclase
MSSWRQTSSTTLPCPGRRPGCREQQRSGRCTRPASPICASPINDLVAEGDKVGVRRTYQGTHKGELLGVPPTGNHLQFAGISIFRRAGGKIAESWEQVNLLAMMQQLGALPTPGQGTP